MCSATWIGCRRRPVGRPALDDPQQKLAGGALPRKGAASVLGLVSPEQAGKRREGLVGGGGACAARLPGAWPGLEQTLVLVVVAEQAQQLPVGAVGGIVVVVVVAVVDGQVVPVTVARTASGSATRGSRLQTSNV